MGIRVRQAVAGGVAALALLVSGCADGGEDLLVELGLDGLTGKEIVERLDASDAARPLEFSASVREREVIISDGVDEVSVALPADEYYVSVAPYFNSTHECYYHNLGTCRGELAGQQVAVVITDSQGEVLVDESTVTHANGFVGFWLPRDVTGVIQVRYGDAIGAVPFQTTDGSPTCVTTLQLT